MKLLTTSVVSAAILAAASFGVSAQTQQQLPQGGDAPANKQAPAQGGGGAAAPEMRGGAGGAGGTGGSAGQPGKPGEREAQSPSASDRPATADTKAKDSKDSAQKPGSGSDSKAADQGKSGDRDSSKAADQGKSGSDSKSADQGKSGGGKQASKEIKAEQKTVIKQTIVKQNIRPAKIDVDVRVGVAVPRTVVLHPLPPTIIEIYPAYRSYRFVLADDNTILVIDPVTWEIVDIIEV